MSCFARCGTVKPASRRVSSSSCANASRVRSSSPRGVASRRVYPRLPGSRRSRPRRASRLRSPGRRSVLAPTPSDGDRHHSDNPPLRLADSDEHAARAVSPCRRRALGGRAMGSRSRLSRSPGTVHHDAAAAELAAAALSNSPRAARAATRVRPAAVRRGRLGACAGSGAPAPRAEPAPLRGVRKPSLRNPDYHLRENGRWTILMATTTMLARNRTAHGATITALSLSIPAPRNASSSRGSSGTLDRLAVHDTDDVGEGIRDATVGGRRQAR